MNTILEKKLLNRKEAPNFRKPSKIDLIEPKKIILKNGIPLFIIEGGTEDLVKLEVSFMAGSKYESKPTLAHACNHLLTSGTSKYSAEEIAKNADYYGAFLESEVSFDTGSIVLYTLSKYLNQTAPMVIDQILDCTFPQIEIDNHIKTSKEKLKVKLEKNEYLARQKFSECLFGPKHPFGKPINELAFDSLTQNDILEFYKKHYQQLNFSIILTGKLTKSGIQNVIDLFEAIQLPKGEKITESILETESKNGNTFLERKDSLQSAIRIGKILFNKTHSDFFGFKVLNEILGGYFGSRLMKNIREEKGYTYGIQSGIMSYQDFGFFFIGTEVGTKFSKNTLVEVYKEIEILKTELVPEEELELVKNYMTGSFMSSLENIFSHSDKFKGIYLYNLGYDYYTKYFNAINNISAEEIRELAIKYLDTNSFVEVLVGKKS